MVRFRRCFWLLRSSSAPDNISPCPFLFTVIKTIFLSYNFHFIFRTFPYYQVSFTTFSPFLLFSFFIVTFHQSVVVLHSSSLCIFFSLAFCILLLPRFHSIEFTPSSSLFFHSLVLHFNPAVFRFLSFSYRIIRPNIPYILALFCIRRSFSSTSSLQRTSLTNFYLHQWTFSIHSFFVPQNILYFLLKCYLKTIIHFLLINFNKLILCFIYFYSFTYHVYIR